MTTSPPPPLVDPALEETDVGLRPASRWRSLSETAWELIGLGLVAVVLVVTIMGLLGLIAARSEALQEARRAALGPAAREAVNTVVMRVEPRPFADMIRLPGRIRAFEEVALAATRAGVVARREGTPIAEGSRVRRGTPILYVDPELCQLEVERAAAARDRLRKDENRLVSLLDRGAASPADLDRLREQLTAAEVALSQAKIEADRCALRSPIAGIADRVYPSAGEWVNRGQTVATLVNIDRVKIDVAVPERDVSFLDQLDRVRFTVDALGGRAYEGTKAYVSTRTVEGALVYGLVLVAANPDHALRPGMFVEADVVRARRPDALVVPLFAVVPRGEDRLVFVARKEGEGWVAAERRVELGALQGTDVELLSGLEPGELVVVVGQGTLADGQPIEVVRTVTRTGDLWR